MKIKQSLLLIVFALSTLLSLWTILCMGQLIVSVLGGTFGVVLLIVTSCLLGMMSLKNAKRRKKRRRSSSDSKRAHSMNVELDQTRVRYANRKSS